MTVKDMFFKQKSNKTSQGYEIIRSKRKSISIEIKRDLSVLVRVPEKLTNSDVERFVKDKQAWIDKNITLVKTRIENEIGTSNVNKLTNDELKILSKEAKKYLPKRAEIFADKMGVKYNRIAIRSQRTLWGSCSNKNNLNFNCLLMLCPEEVRDYVVVHELCHLKEMNHSKNFWTLVEKYCPDYKTHRQWLKTEGKNIIARIS